jgi:cell division protein FtsW
VASIVRVRADSRAAAENTEVNTRLRIFLKAIVGMLAVIGVGATISASSVDAASDGLDFWFYGLRQAAFLGLGVIVMAIAARVPHDWYRRLALPIWLVATGALVATLAIGAVRGGARRWIEVGPIDIQASELMKFAVIVALAAVFARKEASGLLDRPGHFFTPVLVFVGVAAGLVMLQPDLGTTLVIGMCAFGVILASRARLAHVAGLVAVAGLLGAVAAVVAPYRFARVQAWLDPAADPAGVSYHLNQSLAALGSGGPLGVGIGESAFRWDYLPNAHTDFIFSIIGEELGFAGTVFVVALFAGLTVIGVTIAVRAPDRFSSMVAAGLTAWISLQAFVNIGGVTGLLPITGMTLPFVSYGGSSLLVVMGAVGVLLGIAGRGGARAA